MSHGHVNGRVWKHSELNKRVYWDTQYQPIAQFKQIISTVDNSFGDSNWIKLLWRVSSQPTVENNSEVNPTVISYLVYYIAIYLAINNILVIYLSYGFTKLILFRPDNNENYWTLKY